MLLPSWSNSWQDYCTVVELQDLAAAHMIFILPYIVILGLRLPQWYMESEFLEIFAVDTLDTHQAYDTGTYHRNVQVVAW